MTAVADVARALRAEARETNERRLLVLAGSREVCYRRVVLALDAAGIDHGDATLVGERDVAGLRAERVPAKRADRLLGTTRDAVVLDAHDACRPNALGRVVGAVDGGGLLCLLAPPLDDWPERRDGFDEGLAVPPYGIDDVGDRFRRRLVATLRAHPGVAVVDVDADRVERDGLTRPAPRLPRASTPDLPADRAFPAAAYGACLTADQAEALAAFERLREPGVAVVVEADRGRGKSSAAGLAAACLANEGRDVLVTAPGYRNAAELFVRAAALLRELDALDASEGEPPRSLRATGGGRVRFAAPPEAATLPDDPDVVLVDEAAALPVGLLADLLAADRLGFATTVRGYEGAGRGFDVRFRERLAADREVVDARLVEPIRYAAGDPVEVWAFRALALDARPPVDALVAGARPEAVAYRALDPEALLADENLLREAFGLLVVAHYRTEPDDLARLLDAPNLRVRALCHDGHVVSVALLAREGGLSGAWRRRIYEGGRIRGNMLPDVLASQLRDEAAAAADGVRIVRIATHHAVRSRGLGSRLLREVHGEFADEVDWLGVGYGATPELCSFWRTNGFHTVHLSTTRNETSGEYSALMLAPTSDRGRAIHDRHADWFAGRIPAVLSDVLSDLDPDVARAALGATDADVPLDLSERAWRLVASAAYGPALADVDPRPFRTLARKQLIDPADPDLLTPREERLLVSKALQARPWSAVADELDFHSTGQCMRAFGDAYVPLVDAYGSETAREERARYADGE